MTSATTYGDVMRVASLPGSNGGSPSAGGGEVRKSVNCTVRGFGGIERANSESKFRPYIRPTNSAKFENTPW